ncbi:hypothetical protein Godav_001726 [Gossypium davidsonii]|uniref:BRX domain-containing protein n=2 Tax=Gossypium TaxID=3633 RepID=A0A7J8T3V7_GOSDV|nr:hypothetical protein [Gossypium davidsonii]MBA0668869.1 hypothetical protein [Gossypium klotzschianum]
MSKYVKLLEKIEPTHVRLASGSDTHTHAFSTEREPLISDFWYSNLENIRSVLKYSLFSLTSREMFNKWQAQRWWAENYDRVMELYNVQRLHRQAFPLPTPPRSEDEASF